jgi:hypothetical protein
MVAEAHWFAVGGFSLLMTLAWLFADRRIMVTSLFATAGWAWMGFTASGVTRYTETGTEIALDVGAIQYVVLGLALLSGLVPILYSFGHYPPRSDDATEIPADA